MAYFKVFGHFSSLIIKTAETSIQDRRFPAWIRSGDDPNARETYTGLLM